MRAKAFLFAFLAAFLLWACATSPLGRKQLILVPEDQLDQAGRQAFAQEMKRKPTVQDPALNRYVRCVADAVLRSNSIPGKWQVAVFDAPKTVNAFAVPGGRIGVYSGILKVANTQDKLAAVLSHEIGHVLARHAAERISEEMAVNAALNIASAAAGLEGASGQRIMSLMGLGAQVGVLLPFSRTHEAEADRIGLRLMAKAGFNPRAAVSLWRAMAAQDGKKLEFLSTHPSDERRIQTIEADLPQVMPIFEAAQSRPRCGP